MRYIYCFCLVAAVVVAGCAPRVSLPLFDVEDIEEIVLSSADGQSRVLTEAEMVILLEWYGNVTKVETVADWPGTTDHGTIVIAANNPQESILITDWHMNDGVWFQKNGENWRGQQPDLQSLLHRLRTQLPASLE